MSEVIFSHAKMKNTLTIPIGPNGISWAYKLNTASYSTYGGEVIQILSCWIENMTVEGEVRKYTKAEEIYEFFAEYFTIATQGDTSEAGLQEARFEQTPMIMEYPERLWTFYIQPLSAPGFLYSKEMVAPAWKLEAHIIDQDLYNQELKEFVGQFAEKQLAEQGGHFTLTGELSPINGDPANNPFIAPLVPKLSEHTGEKPKFEPIKLEEQQALTSKYADYYTSLLPSYLEGDFHDVASVSASSPVFGKPGLAGAQKEREVEQKELAKVK